MKGHTLARRRRELGASLDDVASSAAIDAETLAQWESLDLRIPRHEAALLAMAFWLIERRQVAERSGVPECDWARAMVGAPDRDAAAIGAHQKACASCRARDDYVRRHGPPAPRAAFGAVGAVLARAGRLPSPLAGAVTGALTVLIFTAVPILVLVGFGAFVRDTTQIAAAGALLLVSVAGGGAGGLTYALTQGWHERGTVAYYASWILSIYAYLAVTLATIVALPGAGLEQERQETIAMLGDPVFVVIMLVVGATFAIWMGRAAHKMDTEPDAFDEPVSSGRAQTFLKYGFGVLVLAAFGVQWWAGREELENLGIQAPTAEAAAAILDSLTSAAAATPDDAAAQYALGMALASLERYDEAESPLERAVGLVPRNPSFQNAHGYTLLQLARYDEAAHAFERAVDLSPDYLRAWVNLGHAHANESRFDDAAAAFQHASAIDSADAELHVLHARALLAARRYEESYAVAAAAMRRDSSSAPLAESAARALLGLARTDEALDLYRTATRIAPDDLWYWRELARMAHLTGHFAEADSAFTRVQALQPDYFQENSEDRALWEDARARAT